jgi:hypothetical protein
MLSINDKAVYLCCGATDMRKQINGLMTLVQSSFKLDPFNGALFVFCNRNRDRIKILEWSGDGFWLYFKRLEKGRFRWWPKRQERSTSDGNTPDEAAIMSLTSEELAILLSSVRVELKLSRNEVLERKIV